jgi:hypothetical protein
LTPQERVVAHAAAVVVGDDFDADSLAETVAIDVVSVLVALDQLAERDLVRLDATGRFRYRHPLVRSVAYQDAGPGWRLQAHGRAAAALRRRGAPPAEFARHVERSAVRGDLESVAALTEAAEATFLEKTAPEPLHQKPQTRRRGVLRRMPDAGSPPRAETAFVGDDMDADAVGSRDAGLIPVWLDRAMPESGAGGTSPSPPTGVIRIESLRELSTVLPLS